MNSSTQRPSHSSATPDPADVGATLISNDTMREVTELNLENDELRNEIRQCRETMTMVRDTLEMMIDAAERMEKSQQAWVVYYNRLKWFQTRLKGEMTAAKEDARIGVE
ncbi:hypothetical protein NHQ30_008978 [Ciborinia camelliae]|nr:hypothetical protein NHQ30_008978 [Ciborinia camelliae]